MFAVSKRFTPASKHMSTCRVAPATSVEPTLSNGPLPPKVIVPRVSDETNRPDRPRRRYSIYPPVAGTKARASVARPDGSPRDPPHVGIFGLSDLRPVAGRYRRKVRTVQGVLSRSSPGHFARIGAPLPR